MTQTALGFGFRVGHWTEPGRHTGCTVILPPPGNVASCDIRGSSPSSRELPLLDLDRRLTEVHAVLLTGGSAFGLAAAEGVVGWLERRDIGYRTRIATIPIVPAAVIFDATAGSPDLRPGPDAGCSACDAATEGPVETGLVGAGAGATVGKWAGLAHSRPGGLGIALASAAGHAVSALVVVNAVGDVVGADGSILAGSAAPEPRPPIGAPEGDDGPSTNTVIGLVAVEGSLDKREVRWLAARGSDGITVAVRPAHTRYDGDVMFAVAAPSPEPAVPHNLDLLGQLATDAVTAAVRAAVGTPSPAPPAPG